MYVFLVSLKRMEDQKIMLELKKQGYVKSIAEMEHKLSLDDMNRLNSVSMIGHNPSHEANRIITTTKNLSMYITTNYG